MKASHTRSSYLMFLLLFLLAFSVWKAKGQGLQTRGLAVGRRSMSGMMGIKKDKPTLSPIENLRPFSAAPVYSKSPTLSIPSTELPSVVLIPTPGHTDTPTITKTNPPSKVSEPSSLSPVVASQLSPVPITAIAPVDMSLSPFSNSPVAFIPFPTPTQGDGEPTTASASPAVVPYPTIDTTPSTNAPSKILGSEPIFVEIDTPAFLLELPETEKPVGTPPSSFFAPTPPPNRLGSPVSFPAGPDLEVAACFSGSTTVMLMVEHHNKDGDGTAAFVAHAVAIKDLKIGDRIAVGDGVYEPIYSFGHYPVNSGHSYQLLEIKTSSHHPISQSEQEKKTQNHHRARPYKGTLQISHSHLVFLVSRPSSSSSPPSGGLVEDYQHYAGSSTGVNMMAVPASSIQVGDYLWLDESNKNKSGGHAVRVDSITPRSTMVNDGLYAPFTPSGKLLVNHGLLVSSYIGLDGSSADVTILDISLGDGMSTRTLSLTFQWLAHSFEFPHRVMCYYLASCPKESYDENGISTWMSMPLKMATTWIMSSSSGQTTASNKDTCLDNDNNNNNNKILRSVIWLVLVSVLVVFNMMEVLLFQSFVLKPAMSMTATAMMIMIGCIVWCKHAKRGSKNMQGQKWRCLAKGQGKSVCKGKYSGSCWGACAGTRH